ncbi:hypothetical protein [Bradyrhizobium sp.]|uniref:hypothetical protein n=1 Tax=Bradyrhizobium sp. TaxID=376 RepID=UPI00239B0AE0|nr:hypothetical protein [Bradyrhizobium sp.]MDE2376684.1 hypothetical protein [Bradyrhizobium sp.]
MEWSILCGEPTGATVCFIDEGIDTGSWTVHWEDVAVGTASTIAEAKANLFSLDAVLYRKAVKKIAAGVPNGLER